MVMNSRTHVRRIIVSAALCLAVTTVFAQNPPAAPPGCRRRRTAAGTRRHGGTDPDSAALHARADCGGSGASRRAARRRARSRRSRRRRSALPHARSARRPEARQVRRRRGRAQHEARHHPAPARGHVRSEFNERAQPRLRQLRSRLRPERPAGAAGQLPRVDLLQHRGSRESLAADDRVVSRRAGRCVDLGEPRLHVRRELWTARLRGADTERRPRTRRGRATCSRRDASGGRRTAPPAAGAPEARARTRRSSGRSGPDVWRADFRHQRSAEAPPGRGRADLPRFAHAFDRHGSQRQGEHLHLRLRQFGHSIA